MKSCPFTYVFGSGVPLLSVKNRPKHHLYTQVCARLCYPDRAIILERKWKICRNQAVAAAVRFCWKHSRQNTGRPCVGLKGTVVSLPHWEQVVRVSTLG